jgi:hypothetical protein
MEQHAQLLKARRTGGNLAVDLCMLLLHLRGSHLHQHQPTKAAAADDSSNSSHSSSTVACTCTVRKTAWDNRHEGHHRKWRHMQLTSVQSPADDGSDRSSSFQDDAGTSSAGTPDTSPASLPPTTPQVPPINSLWEGGHY